MPTVAQPAALLEPGDPPAVEVVNPQGGSPLLLLCDHASNAVPRALDRLGLDEAVLRLHVAWDIGAAEVARRLAARFDAPLALSGFSRLVIDCNRRPGHPASIPVVSDGIAIPGNRDLDDDAVERRRAACFRPYHEAVERLIAGFAARKVVPAVLSIHSFTPVFGGVPRPWHVGVLWNRDPRIPERLLAGLGADPRLVVGDNQPYDARDDHGYSMKRHAEDAGLPHALIEIRQDLIDTRHGAEEWAYRIGDALSPILADPTLYRIERY
ncbi:MAG TPA: N-formylglutamate amidohydrolase [Alphaproteobacteria bacterium]|jgi:predicted N-formylglutamate amidohydrolase